jgi:outer membrane immunogenic protein
MKFSWVVLALLGSVSAASAADMLPASAPLSRAPLAPVYYDWSGFYVGVSVGGRWSDDQWTTTAVSSFLIAPDPSSAVAKFDPGGVRAGGYLGYNWQVSDWVFGIEGDAAWANNKTTLAGIPGTFGPLFGLGPLAFDSARVKEGADGSLRLRAGYLVSPNWLFYSTGGVAFQQVSVNASCAGSLFNASFCSAVRDETASSTRVGWTVGAGVEVSFSPNWLLRGEYRYADYGTLNHDFFAGTITDDVTANVRFHTNTATVGIAYKFGGPVIAKY